MNPQKKFGISLKENHFDDILAKSLDIDFFEIHSENYFDFDSVNFEKLTEVSQSYPISMHGIGLSLGSTEPIDPDLLTKLKKLKKKIQPILISDHLSFSSLEGVHFHDLLPIPYTTESLNLICDKLKLLQDEFSQQFLIENPSLYLEVKGSTFSETDFLNELCHQTECGLLLDINNIFVSSKNLGFEAHKYLKEIDPNFVKEVHLAGHEEDSPNGLLIDTHGTPVSSEVLSLYKQFQEHPYVLLERDSNLPSFNQLYSELQKVKDA